MHAAISTRLMLQSVMAHVKTIQVVFIARARMHIHEMDGGHVTWKNNMEMDGMKMKEHDWTARGDMKCIESMQRMNELNNINMKLIEMEWVGMNDYLKRTPMNDVTVNEWKKWMTWDDIMEEIIEMHAMIGWNGK